MTHLLNVYSGPNARRDFIDPDKRPYISLVELREAYLNPFLNEGVRIFAKLMYEAPCLNIKSLVALEIFRSALNKGMLRGVDKIVEHSSGNFALALAAVGKMFGFVDVESYVPADIASGKELALAIAGVKYTKLADVAGQKSGIELSRKAGRERGVFCPQQYHNEANPAAHEKWTAAQVWEQTGGKISVFCSALGTSGTVIGARRFFERHSAQVLILGALSAPNTTIPGVRTVQKLQEVGLDWRRAVDCHYEVTERAALRLSLELIRSTIMAGPSSGAALAAVHELIAEKVRKFQLNRLRNEDGEVIVVFICSDTFYPYVELYGKMFAQDEAPESPEPAMCRVAV